MQSPDGIDRLVLQEFRLSDATTHAEADGILAAADPDGVPLLTSIADDRDVASVRSVLSGTAADADPIDRSMLGALVAKWQSPRTYRTRIAESSLLPPAEYRLAVTESGINDDDRALPGAPRHSAIPGPDAPTPLALLWIGAPVGTHAGLLVLAGEDGQSRNDEDGASGNDQDAAWPLALSTQLGVRIYRGTARE